MIINYNLAHQIHCVDASSPSDNKVAYQIVNCIRSIKIFLIIKRYILSYSNYLKVVLMICIWKISFAVSENATVFRDNINPWERNQKYCGELLVRAIDIICNEIQKIRPRDTVGNTLIKSKKIKFLKKKCCDNECSLNYIKTNCPGTRKNRGKKNTKVVTSTNSTMSTSSTLTMSTSTTPTMSIRTTPTMSTSTTATTSKNTTRTTISTNTTITTIITTKTAIEQKRTRNGYKLVFSISYV